MKIFKSLLFLALMSLALSVSANNNPDGKLRVKSQVVDNHAIVIQLINLQQVATSVTIKDLDGDTTYFQETVRKHNGYLRKINLENLANGRYLVQVKQGGVSKQQVVLVRGNSLQLSSVKG